MQGLDDGNVGFDRTSAFANAQFRKSTLLSALVQPGFYDRTVEYAGFAPPDIEGNVTTP